MTSTWHEYNQRHLLAAMSRLRDLLQRGLPAAPDSAEPPAVQPDLDTPEAGYDRPPALRTLCTLFRLSAFEEQLLLLCAAVELDSRFAALCAQAQGDPQRPFPTFSLALALLPEAHWSALLPNAPLRRWRLIEVGAGGVLTGSPLRISERVLHYLAGLQALDERLAGMLTLVRPAELLVPSHQAIADEIGTIWSRRVGKGRLPLMQLGGADDAGKRAIAAAACATLGLQLHALPAGILPLNADECEAFARLWEREAALSNSALLIDCDHLDHADGVRHAMLMRLIERLDGVLLASVRERMQPPDRPTVAFEVRTPATGEQRALWQTALGRSGATHLNGQIDLLAAQFQLSAQAIQDAAAEARTHLESGTLADLQQITAGLWEASRAQARPRLDDLAQRIDAMAGWNDLVIPVAQQQVLRDIAAHVRQRARVYENWGFAGKSSRGLGISALFAGASGTGKTMAAEVLAGELQLDLYRIDLSAVVSKYIGETEKNLRRIFDAAESGGAILLFDEADALFGKRSEVKDSHDRYANIEVSYLLQRMEAYRGLAILTTNMKQALDTAFLRRIRFVVQFPFPDAAQRAEIWRRIFPEATPTADLDVEKLARLNVAGGNIRNIALNAAFLAADSNEPVRMEHLLRAARAEYAKLEKTLTETEVLGWTP
jgi:hypothetical protein